MNRIHSGILAIVLSIFLIQATDPPYESNLGTLLQYSTVNDAETDVGKHITTTVVPSSSTERITALPNTPLPNTGLAAVETSSEIPSYVMQHNLDRLRLLHHYLTNIKVDQDRKKEYTLQQSTEKSVSESSNTHGIVNRFLQRGGKSEYEKLLEKDFIRPLLKLYEKEEQKETNKPYLYGNFTTPEESRISKEDTVGELTSVSKEDLELLMQQENYYANAQQQQIRRDDDVDTIDANSDQEHIGEILPSDYKIITSKKQAKPKNPLLLVRKYNPAQTAASLRSTRKSYEGFRPSYIVDNSETSNRFRQPIRLHGERFRLEYEPSVLSSEGHEVFYSRPEPQVEVRPLRSNLPPNEVAGYRAPRKLRGFRETFQEIVPNIGRDQYFDSVPKPPYQPASWGARRPRVIFPTDLVAFKEPNQEEPDWLTAESSLQDIQEQEQDTRDRGKLLALCRCSIIAT